MAGIYLHIPFCKRRCAYCDFFSSTDTEMKDDYVDALCSELSLRSEYLNGETIETIYFGGGTPSQLPLSQLLRLCEHIYKVYAISSDAEVTLEANPDDLTQDYVAALSSSLPVNRISMGVQSFDDARLSFLNRRHTSKQAIDAVWRCREFGIENLSIDLMYGLPNQTLKDWAEDVDRAITLDVPHVSAYHLTYEKGTVLWQRLRRKEISEVNEEISEAMYVRLVELLKNAGYVHYEISNFARPGMESRHNSSYWRAVPYLGCGAAAHSFDGSSRRWNVASIAQYIDGATKCNISHEEERLDADTAYNDYMVTAMRTSWGASLDYVRKHFGRTIEEYCLRMAFKHIERGSLRLENDNLQLTEKGIFISDGIISDLLKV